MQADKDIDPLSAVRPSPQREREMRARRAWMFQLFVTWCVQSTLARLRDGAERTLLATKNIYVRNMQYGTMGMSAAMRRVMLYFPTMAQGGPTALKSWVQWRSTCRGLLMVWRVTDINRKRNDEGRAEIFGGQALWSRRVYLNTLLPPPAVLLPRSYTFSGSSTDAPFISPTLRNSRSHAQPAGPPAFLPPPLPTPPSISSQFADQGTQGTPSTSCTGRVRGRPY